jgi:hypothetical protein
MSRQSHPRTLDAAKAEHLVDALFADSIVPALVEYIRIPNKSPTFDPDWERAGHMTKAMDLIVDWCRAQPLEGMRLEVIRLPDRTPLLFIEIEGEVEDTVLGRWPRFGTLRQTGKSVQTPERGTPCPATTTTISTVPVPRLNGSVTCGRVTSVRRSMANCWKR